MGRARLHIASPSVHGAPAAVVSIPDPCSCSIVEFTGIYNVIFPWMDEWMFAYNMQLPRAGGKVVCTMTELL